MMGHIHWTTARGEARAIALHHHFGVPSLALQPDQIERDDILLKEIVLRSRIEYVAAECCADDKALNPDAMARRFGLLLTCEASDPPVSLSCLLREVRRRADSGSALATRFLHEYDAAGRLHATGQGAIETIVQSLIVGRPGSLRPDFISQLLGNHGIACGRG
jgi:hypothetical protein